MQPTSIALPVSFSTRIYATRFFSLDEIDATTEAGRLTRDAYALLYDLADDQREADEPFGARGRHCRGSFDPHAASPG